MKKIIISAFLCISSVLIYAQQVKSLKIHSEIFNKDRDILVYTPWEYENIENSRFEVIYIFDAQDKNYFDYVYSTLSFLNNLQFPMIVVGIVSEERNKDFLPENDYPETVEHFGGYLGEADDFLNFMSDEVIPYLDSNYRTLPKRIAIGHSNGGTFLMYCLTQKPELFDAYLTISPNWSYDKEQPVRRIEQFDWNQLNSKKYIYTCNSNEEEYWKTWGPAREKALNILENASKNDKIIFENQDFSKSENHTTVFPIAVFNGLKKYLNYQFFTADNLIDYYSDLIDQKIVEFTPDQLNQLAYDIYFYGKVQESIKILHWANKMFPENLNLYDSLGEMYQNTNNFLEALNYYNLFEEKLEQNRNTYTQDEYEDLKKGINERIKYINEKIVKNN